MGVQAEDLGDVCFVKLLVFRLRGLDTGSLWQLESDGIKCLLEDLCSLRNLVAQGVEYAQLDCAVER